MAQIYSLALYETRDAHAAEDITEGVFLKALAALPRFREQGEGEDQATLEHQSASGVCSGRGTSEKGSMISTGGIPLGTRAGTVGSM